MPLLQDFQAGDDGGIHAVFLPERRKLQRVRSLIDHLVGHFARPPLGGLNPRLAALRSRSEAQSNMSGCVATSCS